MIQRPWQPMGIGWLVALLVFLVAFLSLFVAVTVQHLTVLLIIGLALALLLG